MFLFLRVVSKKTKKNVFKNYFFLETEKLFRENTVHLIKLEIRIVWRWSFQFQFTHVNHEKEEKQIRYLIGISWRQGKET
jgi:hypothetical protein